MLSLGTRFSGGIDSVRLMVGLDDLEGLLQLNNSMILMHIVVGNKHEFKICVQLQAYDLAGIKETWWDGTHD